MTQTELYEKCREALHCGYFWCLACHTITDLDNPGEPHQSCHNCGSHRVCWMPPVLTPETDKNPATVTQRTARGIVVGL